MVKAKHTAKLFNFFTQVGQVKENDVVPFSRFSKYIAQVLKHIYSEQNEIQNKAKTDSTEVSIFTKTEDNVPPRVSDKAKYLILSMVLHCVVKLLQRAHTLKQLSNGEILAQSEYIVSLKHIIGAYQVCEGACYSSSLLKTKVLRGENLIEFKNGFPLTKLITSFKTGTLKRIGYYAGIQRLGHDKYNIFPKHKKNALEPRSFLNDVIYDITSRLLTAANFIRLNKNRRTISTDDVRFAAKTVLHMKDYKDDLYLKNNLESKVIPKPLQKHFSTEKYRNSKDKETDEYPRLLTKKRKNEMKLKIRRAQKSQEEKEEEKEEEEEEEEEEEGKGGKGGKGKGSKGKGGKGNRRNEAQMLGLAPNPRPRKKRVIPAKPKK